MEQAVHFRRATLDDIPQLLNHEQSVLAAERPFNPIIRDKGAYYYQLDKLLVDEAAYVLVGEVEGNIIATGYVQIRPSKPALRHENHGYLGFMYVDPAFRGQGLNQRVIRQLVEWARQKGISDFYLDVYANNESATRAYEKLGFVPTLMEMRLNLD